VEHTGRLKIFLAWSVEKQGVSLVEHYGRLEIFLAWSALRRFRPEPVLVQLDHSNGKPALRANSTFCSSPCPAPTTTQSPPQWGRATVSCLLRPRQSASRAVTRTLNP